MALQQEEHERTMLLAQIALGKIKALRQHATPRNYDIWYTYAAGCNSSFTDAINGTLARDGSLTDEKVEEFCEEHLSSTRLIERTDAVGAKVVLELERIIQAIEDALGTTSGHTDRLVTVSQNLVSARSREAIRDMIGVLLTSVRELQVANRSLEDRLQVSRRQIDHLQEAVQQVRSDSLTDGLTGLANRRHFDHVLSLALAEAKGSGNDLSLVLADIDDFKLFNDANGHPTGDQVLRLAAQALKQNIKGQDFAARCGGEEFAVILPKTSLQQALIVADHIRRGLGSKELIKRSTGQNLGRVTMSVGVATLHDGDTAQQLIERADGCLYRAKRNGRNSVVCETDPEKNRGIA